MCNSSKKKKRDVIVFFILIYMPAAFVSCGPNGDKNEGSFFIHCLLGSRRSMLKRVRFRRFNFFEC